MCSLGGLGKAVKTHTAWAIASSGTTWQGTTAPVAPSAQLTGVEHDEVLALPVLRARTAPRSGFTHPDQHCPVGPY